MPKYSIVLPVRNGANYIRECIASIIAQEYTDFELLILENASTDDTPEIIAGFKDSRIRVITSPEPLSMVDNWKRIVSIPKQELMTMIGHDDLLDVSYLKTMNSLVEENPKASLYLTHFRYINGLGKEIGKCQTMNSIMKGPEAVEGFLSGKIDLMGTGFMMRSRDYDRIGGIPDYPNLLFADMELWIRLAAIHSLAVSREECFSYRKHAAATTSSSADLLFLAAFDRLVHFLKDFKQVSVEMNNAITRSAGVLLSQYGQGISHKVLRVPKKSRQTPSVKEIIIRFRKYGEDLGLKGFDPLSNKMISTGKIIDGNSILHFLFLTFKKFYKKPVVKS